MPVLSPEVAMALESADKLAAAAGFSVVQTTHLAMGGLRQRDSPVVTALLDVGVTLGDVEDIVGRAASDPRSQLLAGASADTVPEPGQGRVRNADRLGAAADVEKAVLLAHDTPLPLAVGLFGDWGSGKSFYMALMQERIAELSQAAAQELPDAWPYCKEVRQVRFNAWHYVDADLWSSLAATLFDELARVESPTEADRRANELEKAREEVVRARQERQSAELEVARLEATAAGPGAAVHTAVGVAIRAVRDEKIRRALKQAASDQPADGDKDTLRLVEALGQVQESGERARTLGRLVQEEFLHRRAWLTGIILLGILVAVGVAIETTTVLHVVTFIAAILIALAPALAGATRILYLAREVREKREQPVLEGRDHLAEAVAAEQQAQLTVTQREHEVEALRDKRTLLREFIRERAGSSDYRSRLGVISQVRRDFEQLVALGPGSEPEVAPGQEAASKGSDRAGTVDDASRLSHADRGLGARARATRPGPAGG